MNKSTVTLCCSLFAAKGDALRVTNTAVWYRSLCTTAGHPFRLVLINDQSEESFDDVMRLIDPIGYCTDVKYFKSPDRVGKAKQLNRAFHTIRTEYVGIIDNDVVLPAKWLHDVLRVLAKKEVATCGVLVEDWIEIGDILSAPDGAEGTVPYTFPQEIGGACIVWNRNKLKGEGFLWEGAGIYGHEDAEFNQRVGMRVGMVASLVERGYSISDKTFPQWEEWKKRAATVSVDLFWERMKELVRMSAPRL